MQSHTQLTVKIKNKQIVSEKLDVRKGGFAY